MGEIYQTNRTKGTDFLIQPDLCLARLCAKDVSQSE